MQCQHQPLLEEPGIVPLLRLAESALQTPQPRLFELESLHSQGEEVLALVRQYGKTLMYFVTNKYFLIDT